MERTAGVTAYSADDLKWTSTLISKGVGTRKFYTNSRGNVKEVTIERQFVQTAGAGEMEYEEWRGLMEKAVEREGKGELLSRIAAHCKRHCAWLRQDKEIRGYALQCLSSGAYMAWDMESA